MRFLSIFIPIMLTFSGAIAQEKFGEGYYVTNTSDTTHGYIEYKTKYRDRIKFRSASKAAIQTLPIAQVKAFGFTSGKTYRRVEYSSKTNLPASPIFVRPIIQGEVELFEYQGKIFIGSENKGRFELDGKKSSSSTDAMRSYQKNTGAFNILFQDCLAVKEVAQKTSVSEDNLVNLLRSYYECRDLPYQQYKSKKLKPMTSLGFFAGYSTASLTIGKPTEISETAYLYNSNFGPSSNPTFGIIALLGGRSPSPIISFQGGLSFTKASHQATWTYADDDFAGYSISETSVTAVKYSQLSVSAGVRLTGRSNTVNPYVSFGLAGHHFLSLEESVNQTTTINNIVVEEENFKLGMAKSSLAVLASAGLKKKILGNKALFAEANYENSYVSINAPKSAKISSIALRVGLMF